MMNSREIRQIEKAFENMKDIIFPFRATWTCEEAKIRKEDGSMTDGAEIDQIINCSIEPIRRGLNVKQLTQGLEENSTHALITLKQWPIKIQDSISYSGKLYRVTYKFLDQFLINYQEYLIQVHTLN